MINDISVTPLDKWEYFVSDVIMIYKCYCSYSIADAGDDDCGDDVVIVGDVSVDCDGNNVEVTISSSK
jgi:hypothetical protein